MLDPKHKVSDKRGMNKLPLAKRTQILAMLCEGSSMRSISRVADVSINTVSKLLVQAGEACLAVHDEHVRGVKASRIQCDEIWSFCYAKQKNVPTAKDAPEGAGDVWTWTALDSETKLMVSYFVGDRTGESAIVLMDDLRSRLANRVQLTTDGHKPYLEAVEGAFGDDIDYAMLIKLYGSVGGKGAEVRYSPAECTGILKRHVTGSPDPNAVSTSHVERMNLSIRMQNRRFTRLTNAFSKKLDNHIHALALYFAFYNFCRIHKTLRMSPAMAAGITDRLWSLDDVVAKIDEMAPAPKVRGPYKKRSA
jgi:IS1 family transposase/lambda repressor-like predicted transcriptional regulator